nr:hypothetical protein [Tanacetum cinerariifolium]
MSPSHRSVGHRPHGAPMRPPHRSAGHRPHGPLMNPRRPTMNGARPYKSFFIQAPSYETRPFLKSSAVKTQYRAPWVPTVNRNNPPVNRKFSTSRRNFPTDNRKFPTASRKFTTGSTKIHTADMGRKGKAAPSYKTRPFLKSLAVKNPYRAPWVPTVNRYDPPVNRKFSIGRSNFPTANRKFPTASRKFTTGSTKYHTADMGRKGKAVKPSACWTWNPSQKLSNKGPNNNSVSMMFKKYIYIDTQGRLKRATLMSKIIRTVAALGA